VSNGLAGIKNFTPDTSALTPIRVDTWGPLIFLHMGDNELPPVAQVMGAGGEQLELEGMKSEEWQFYKRVDYPMARAALPQHTACLADAPATRFAAVQLEMHGR
jgi:hypothetical protein